MRGNRDGSWSLRASANGGSGNGNGVYLPQADCMYSNYIVHQPIRYNIQTQQQNLSFPHPHFGANVEVMRIDNAVNKTRKSLISAGENVSSTRVSQSVLAQLHADSWRSLGIQMHNVPSLHQLMALEGKIFAFIHCFIGARRIVTLHDLEVAICRNEFVGCFDDLGLGPLLQHPLVLLYFPSISGSTGPVQITSEEIIPFFDSYLNTYDMDDVKLDEFLNFVAEKKSVTSKERLGVRIQSLRMYVSFIQDAKRQEGETLKILLTELHQKYRILSSKKQQQDNDYCGKHTRFNSLRSEYNGSADYEVENVNSSDYFSSCPYPSVAEEIKQLGSSSKKRKAESRSHEKSDFPKLLRRDPSKLRRGHAKQEIPKLADDSDAKQVFSVNEADSTLSEGALRLFVSTWKDTCKELSMSMLVEKILSSYNLGGSEVQAQIKRAKVMSSFPFVGLLHVAKEYFNLSVNEWKFANEKGESYVIAHVLLGNSNAILTRQRNLVKLCQQGHLRLLIPKETRRTVSGLMGDSSASSNRVKLRDGRFLAYRERGVPKDEAKYKIILVHGFGSSKDMNFSASNELIEELGVYLLFYDRSGYGESDSNTKRSLESEVDDIAELADQLKLGPKFYLIGISMGSYPTWGCLKHIPHRLSGVAFVAPVVNYKWPSLPKKLIKKDYRSGIIKWGLRISKYAPGLLHWWVIQKILPSTSSVLESNPIYFNSHDMEVLKRTTGFPMLTKDSLRERDVFDTLRDDLMACFGRWDFEPADLCISQESSIHIWHGKEDKVVPFQLQRCILQKQPLINYHEIPQGGHLIVHYDGICDSILRALLLEE